MKKQKTELVFLSQKSKNTGMMVEIIKNKEKGRPFDVIQFTILTDHKNKNVIFRCSPEEALEIAWAMTKGCWHFLNGFEPYQKFRTSGDSQTKYPKKTIKWSI